MIHVAYTVASWMRYRPGTPERDWRYLKFIRQFPCVGCGSTRYIEAMHTGSRGLGQKAADRDALPGCPKCHRTGLEALHKIGPLKFQEVHRIDFAELRTMFQRIYQERNP